MRRAVTPTIPPKMYRHFAVVTVLLTAAVAMFAGGENRKAVAAQVENAEENGSQVESAPALATRSGDNPAPVVGSFGSDDGIVFGQPMDNPLGGLSSSVFAKLDGAEAAGYPPDYLASLTPAERELLIKGLEENGLLTDEARADRGAALESASRRRSGAPSSG